MHSHDGQSLPEDQLIELDSFIENKSKTMIENTLFDMFLYFNPDPDTKSKIGRANCLGMCVLMQELLEKETKNVYMNLNSLLIPCATVELTSEVPLTFPYEHSVLAINLGSQLVGFIDPSYGVYSPVRKDKKVTAGSWEFVLLQDNVLYASKPGKEMHIQMDLENPVHGKESVANYQKCIWPALGGSFSCILSHETGKRLNKLEASARSVLYRDMKGTESTVDISNSKNIAPAMHLIDFYINDLKVYYGDDSFDFNHFANSVSAYVGYRKQLLGMS